MHTKTTFKGGGKKAQINGRFLQNNRKGRKNDRRKVFRPLWGDRGKEREMYPWVCLVEKGRKSGGVFSVISEKAGVLRCRKFGLEGKRGGRKRPLPRWFSKRPCPLFLLRGGKRSSLRWYFMKK